MAVRRHGHGRCQCRALHRQRRPIRRELLHSDVAPCLRHGNAPRLLPECTRFLRRTGQSGSRGDDRSPGQPRSGDHNPADARTGDRNVHGPGRSHAACDRRSRQRQLAGHRRCDCLRAAPHRWRLDGQARRKARGRGRTGELCVRRYGRRHRRRLHLPSGRDDRRWIGHRLSRPDQMAALDHGAADQPGWPRLRESRWRGPACGVRHQRRRHGDRRLAGVRSDRCLGHRHGQGGGLNLRQRRLDSDDLVGHRFPSRRHLHRHRHGHGRRRQPDADPA